jgi:hypothetical protein
MQQIIQDKNIRLCYFMVQTNKGVGYICMALQRPNKDSDSVSYKAAFSFCSPQEGKRFSKQKARAMAVGRLATFDRGNSPDNNRIDFDCAADNLTDVFKYGLELVENVGNVPSWVRNRKGLIFGLNVNGPMTETKALKA